MAFAIWGYRHIIKPLLFRFDPEKIHDAFTRTGRFLGEYTFSRNMTSFLFDYENKKLETIVAGIKFRNPVGLAAGFDKNAALVDIIPSVGFGFMEIGSITFRRCEGNPKPRLWRLPKDDSIAVNYGLCNDGACEILKRLKGKKFRIPIGISIAKTNDASIKGKYSVEDYHNSYKIFKNFGSYITINISCPNTGDGKRFEDPELLDNLLKVINIKDRVVFLKISPDLSIRQINQILKIAGKYNVSGFIVGNLTKKRHRLRTEKPMLGMTCGGLSGAPTRDKSTRLIGYIYKKTKGRYVIIGLGGIFNADHAYEKIRSGASLVQLITGIIYNGPAAVKEINKGLVKLLEKDGYSNISEAVGANFRSEKITQTTC